MIKRIILFLILTCMITSCSLLSPVKSDYTTYVLRNNPCVSAQRQTNSILYVAPVEADPLYDTDYMAYSTHPIQVEYYAKNKWADTPARMLKPLILQTLRGTHHFRAITTSPNVPFTYRLNTNILELRQVFTCTGSYVAFRLHVEVVRASTGKIIVSRELCSTRIMCKPNPYSGAWAANQAVANVLEQLGILMSHIN